MTLQQGSRGTTGTGMKIFPFLAFAGGIFALSHHTASANDDKMALIEEGRYLAAASDCAACHSIKNKPEYSGGVSFTLPVGTIHSTNITPDMEHGIGKYTEAEFGCALREGIRRGIACDCRQGARVLGKA